MVQLVLGMSRAARARRRGRRAGHRDLGRQHGPRSASLATAGVLRPRGCRPPITRGETGVRAGRPRGPGGRARAERNARSGARARTSAVRPMIASVEGSSERSPPTRWSSRSAGSAIGSSPRRRPRHGAARRARSSCTRSTSSARTSRRCTASATAEELGSSPAADRDRRRAEGRPGDRGSAADRRPAAGDHGPGPGRAGRDPGHRQEARRADHLRAQGEGRGGRRVRVGRRRSRARPPARARSSRRSRRWAIRWPRLARHRGRRWPMSGSIEPRGAGQGGAAEPSSGSRGRRRAAATAARTASVSIYVPGSAYRCGLPGLQRVATRRQTAFCGRRCAGSRSADR